MFSMKEKQELASKVEELLLAFNHPEMPKEKPVFYLRVEGKESWSWAEIRPNWTFSEPPKANPWNEVARDVLADEGLKKSKS